MGSILGMETALRLALLYVHLLLCVFALHAVLSSDWRLLRAQMSAPRLERTHQRVLALLLGLWASGLAIVALDAKGQWGPILENPKLLAKLLCVLLLTLNAVVLRWWCFPRLVSNRPLGLVESWVLMSSGAVSTSCWLMSGFYGVAKPLKDWPLSYNLILLVLVIAVAVPIAISMAHRLRRGRRLRLRHGGHEHRLLAATTMPADLAEPRAQAGWVAKT